MKKEIILAGGCFWGVEAYYQRLNGVLSTKVGYVNGNLANPRYEDLLSKKATHAEAVYLEYEDTLISLEKILEHLFRFIDPFSINQQGNDIGLQYRTGIYYLDETDLPKINKFLDNEQERYYRKRIVVEVEKNRGFYPAEEYHQNYLLKNPFGYCHVDLGLIRKDEKK